MAPATFVYDDDCGFCTWWARFFAARTDVPTVGFTDLDQALTARLPADYEDCSHVVTAERVYSCGASIEEMLVRTAPGSWARPVVDRLRTLGPYRALREWAYRIGAENRSLWGRLLSRRPPARSGERDDSPRQ